MNLIKIENNNFKDKEKLYKINDEAFPDEERIDSEKIINYCLNLNCEFWGIYNNDEFIGFTVVLPSKEFKIAYVWFLAIGKKYRSKGFGGRTLQELNKIYSDYQLVLDLEQQKEDAPNLEQRRKRLDFYLGNGYKRTGYGMTYYDVDYEILCNRADFSNKTFQEFILSLNRKDFKPEIYAIQI